MRWVLVLARVNVLLVTDPMKTDDFKYTYELDNRF